MHDEIVLDPGHGGLEWRGNSSPNGSRFGGGGVEQHVNFRLAQQVSALVSGARLTRRAHENRSIGERIDEARRTDARAFVSLHARPGGQGGVWVHPRASSQSAQLAEQIRRELHPISGGCAISRGDLAVLAPERHARDTAACLVELGLRSGDAPLGAVAAALARGLRAHVARYGRVTPAGRGLDVAAPMLGGSFAEIAGTIADWLARQVVWRAGVLDTRSFPFSGICKLVFTDEDGGTYGGTGFYVSPTRILTAAHNIIDYNADTARLAHTVSMTVTPGLNGTTEPYGHFDVTDRGAFVEHGSWIGSDGAENESFDLGVVKVDGHPPPNGDYFRNLDTRAVSVGNVAICGYAGGDLDSSTQHCDIDLVRDVSGDMETGDYNASTEHGTSGAPVFYTLERPGDTPDIGVIGVHVSSKSISGTPGDDRRLNMFCRLTEEKVRWIRAV